MIEREFTDREEADERVKILCLFVQTSEKIVLHTVEDDDCNVIS